MAADERSASVSDDRGGSDGLAVRAHGVAKGFDEGTVIEDIDLNARSGEITLLMGANGVGKTVFLSCVAAGLAPDAGAVSVFGRDPADARENLSFMLQDGMLVDELSGRENVAFFRDLHPRSTDRWRELLEDLAFDTDALDREVGDYSGGMKRKLELAISLSVDVPLYLLDEPTAALDMTTVDRLHSLLDERREAGDAVVMTSHLPVDAQLADRIAFVRADGVVASGEPAALLEGVPPVARVEGLRDGFDELVREGRLFETGSERRGFLRADVDPDAVEERVDRAGTSVRVTDPTVTDLFNYYVHVVDGP